MAAGLPFRDDSLGALIVDRRRPGVLRHIAAERFDRIVEELDHVLGIVNVAARLLLDHLVVVGGAQQRRIEGAETRRFPLVDRPVGVVVDEAIRIRGWIVADVGGRVQLRPRIILDFLQQRRRQGVVDLEIETLGGVAVAVVIGCRCRGGYCGRRHRPCRIGIGVHFIMAAGAVRRLRAQGMVDLRPHVAFDAGIAAGDVGELADIALSVVLVTALDLGAEETRCGGIIVDVDETQISRRAGVDGVVDLHRRGAPLVAGHAHVARAFEGGGQPRGKFNRLQRRRHPGIEVVEIAVQGARVAGIAADDAAGRHGFLDRAVQGVRDEPFSAVAAGAGRRDFSFGIPVGKGFACRHRHGRCPATG